MFGELIEFLEKQDGKKIVRHVFSEPINCRVEHGNIDCLIKLKNKPKKGKVLSQYTVDGMDTVCRVVRAFIACETLTIGEAMEKADVPLVSITTVFHSMAKEGLIQRIGKTESDQELWKWVC